MCGGGGCVYAVVWYDCGMRVSERMVFYIKYYVTMVNMLFERC